MRTRDLPTLALSIAFALCGSLLVAGCGSDGPRLNYVSPAQGPLAGGTLVQVFGNHFSSRVQVFIGGKPVSGVSMVAPGVLSAITPPGQFPATVSVTVENSDGQRAHLREGFAYLGGMSLVEVGTVTPASGGIGTPVVITGQGFELNATVTFGGVAATSVNVQTATTLTCFAPPSFGVVNVVVTNTDGGTGSLTNGFTYTGPTGRIITTVAGNGTAAFQGDGGAATMASIAGPGGVALGLDGSIYIGDTQNNRVRVVRPTGTIITTLAGNGTAGSSGDNGLATAAELDHPGGVAVDALGDVFVADTGNDAIREITSGTISTIAGILGQAGFAGDGGLAKAATLSAPAAVAVDSSRDIFVADTGNQRIRRIDGVSRIISSVAGNGVATFAGDNGPALAASLDMPLGVAIDALGDVFIGDTANGRIRKVSGGMITTVAGGGTSTQENGPATQAQLGAPSGIAVDATGSIVIADSTTQRVSIVTAGTIATLAGNGTPGFSGDGGLAIVAEVSGPEACAAGAGGVYLIADTGNARVRQVK